jgi:hypothetical protein
MIKLGIEFHSMLSESKGKALSEAVLKAKDIEGEFWDVGCNAGGSAAIMKFTAPRKHIRLFDSFEGLPEATKQTE